MPDVQSFQNQDYELIKKECLTNETLFTDPNFPTNNFSINKLPFKKQRDYDIYWKRPHEFMENPQFIVNGIDPNDLVQGDLGDCWFISAASTLLSIPKLAQFVIPFDQSFDKDYCGLFHFRFWQFGQWVDVVVDDYLPVTVDGDEVDFVFCRNQADRNEFFGPLLEKAYAKLAGCYDFLDGGDPNNAQVDFTGTICENFNIKKCYELTYGTVDDYQEEEEVEEEDANELDEGEDVEDEDTNELTDETYEYEDEELDEQDEFDETDAGYKSTDLESLWTFILKSYKASSLMNASFSLPNTDDSHHLENGLVPGHAYSIIHAVSFNLGKKNIRLLKLRNPHGALEPFNGKWSFGSKEWKKLDKKTKNKFSLKLNPNGEFYTSFEDFSENFHDLNVTLINLDSFYDPDVDFEELTSDLTKSDWKFIQYYGEWKANENAGNELYWNNKQFLIKIIENLKLGKKKRSLEFDRSILISLMQPYTETRRVKNDGEYGFEPIRFDIYSVEGEVAEMHKKNGEKFQEDELENYSTSETSSTREITHRFNLEPGYYVIIPCVDDENVNMKYLLRFFYNHNYFKFEQEF